MRRNSFLTGALVALVTFVALSAFVPRRWRAHYGWGQGQCYYEGRYNRDYNLHDRAPYNRHQPNSDTNNR